MRLSIIVPIYNVENYLRRCLDSILSQTISDFEVILVNDGSEDSCPVICEEYAKKDPRITVLHQRNGGLSAARNAGLNVAKGEYLGFVDGDDVIHPQMYEILLSFMSRSVVDVAQCEFHRFSDDGMPLFTEIDCKEVIPIYMNAEELLKAYFVSGRSKFNQTVCNKVYRRSVFDGIRFPAGFYFEDSYIHVDTLAAIRELAIISLPLYGYYQRNDSIMHSVYSPKWFLSHYQLCEKYLMFFRERNDRVQVEEALDEYIRWFCKDKFSVFFQYPQYITEFMIYEKGYRKEICNIIKCTRICKMKKLLSVAILFFPRIAYRIAIKYFPECIYDFMR